MSGGGSRGDDGGSGRRRDPDRASDRADGGGDGTPRPPRLADLHAHYVPGVDDGAPELADALAYLRLGVDEGVVRVAATPHLPASYAGSSYRRRAEEAFVRLREAVAEELPRLELRLAWELRLDGTTVDVEDEGLWLGPGGHLLVEYDRLTLPSEPMAPLHPLLEAGLTPVLAHPERYAGMERYVGAEEERGWTGRLREAGVRMCLNAGSLLGSHGPRARDVARRMLADGHADLVASDHHARPARSDGLPEVRELLAELDRREAAEALLWRNPTAALDGGEMEPPPAVRWPELHGLERRRADTVPGGAT